MRARPAIETAVAEGLRGGRGAVPWPEPDAEGHGLTRSPIESERTHVFPLELARPMPVVARGEGVWIEDVAGNRYLDAMSGGSMAATLGHGRRDPRSRRGPRPRRSRSSTTSG